MHFHAFGISAFFSAESAALAALGGALLGATVIFKTWLSGNVLGVSGSTRGWLAKWRSLDKAAFVLGLLAAGPAMAAAYGGFEPMPPPKSSESRLLLLRLFAGGLLVGVGTAFGNGCTSGHGLTGLARLSLRSWVAVPTFMAAGVCAASLSGTADVLPPDAATEAELPAWPFGAATACGAAVVLLLAAAAVLALKGRVETWKLVPVIELFSGLVFGVGLAISGMARPSKVAAFLDLRSGSWDPSLAFVMGSALLLTFPFFQILERREGRLPLVGTKFELPPKCKAVDVALVLGAILFGVGWGLAGACPGPVWVLLLAKPSVEVTMIWAGMIAGMGVWVAWQYLRPAKQPAEYVPSSAASSASQSDQDAKEPDRHVSIAWC